MKLQIIFEEYSFEAIQNSIRKYFNCNINLQKEISIFDQWRLGCKDKFIPSLSEKLCK